MPSQESDFYLTACFVGEAFMYFTAIVQKARRIILQKKGSQIFEKLWKLVNTQP